MSLSSKVNYSLEALAGITVGNINITGNIFQNNNPYIASQWTSTSGNALSYTSGNVIISNGTLLVSELTTGNINFTGTLYQNGAPYVGSQWTTTTGNLLTYTSGNVRISNGTLYAGGITAGILYANNSRVGINTTSPLLDFDIRGTSFGVRLSDTAPHDHLYFQTGTAISSIRVGGSILTIDAGGDSGTYGSTSMNYTRVATFTSAGNVGIGTTSPSFNLDVSGTSRITTSLTTGALFSTNQTTTNIVATSSTITNLSVPGTLTVVNITTTNLVDTVISAGTLVATSASAGNLSASIGTISNMLVSNNTVSNSFISGGLGIGTTNPNTSYRLDVAGSIRSGLRLDIGGTQPIYNSNTLGRLFITGAQNSVPNGPNIVITTAQDAFPTYNFLTYGHDSSWTMYDMYFDGGSFRNSATNTAFMMVKENSTLKWNYNSVGFSAGAPATMTTSICIGSGGNVGLGGQVTPAYTLDVSGGARIVSGISAGSSVFSNLYLSSPTNATNVSSGGALTVAGGAAVGGDLIVGGSIIYSNAASVSSSFAYLTLTATDLSTDIANGALVAFGGISVQTTENALSATSGSGLTIGGGAGIGKDLYVGGKTIVSEGISAGSSTFTSVSAGNSQFTGLSAGNINFTGNLFQNGSAYIGSQWVGTSGNIFYGTAGSSRVGINTTSPTYTLDINGSLRANTNDSCLIGSIVTSSRGSLSIGTGGVANSSFRIGMPIGSAIGTSGPDRTYINFTGFDIDIRSDTAFGGTGSIAYFSRSNQQVTLSGTTDTTGIGTGGTLTIAGGVSIARSLVVGTNISSSNLLATAATIPNIIHTNITTNTILVTSGGLNATFNSNTVGALFTTGGNVGIGTSSPATRFDVNGESTFRGSISLEGGTSTSNAGAVDSANLTQTYIAFGQNGSNSDWAYLRQIAPANNNYLMSLDIHDDGNEPGFCIRAVRSTTNPDEINEYFRVGPSGISSGNIQLSSTLIASNGTISNFVGTTLSSSNLVATVATIPNILHTNITTTNIIATSSTITNLNVPGTLTVVNITSTNLVETNITANTIVVTSGGLNATFNSNTIGNIITTGGNIGINSTSPGYRFEVRGDSSAPVGIFYPSTPNNNSVFFVLGKGATTNNAAEIRHFHSSDGSNQNAIRLGAYAAGDFMTVRYDGNVGIGTTAPGTRLDVSGTGRITTSLTTGSLFSTNQTTTNIVATTSLSSGTLVGTTISTANIYGSLGTVSNFVGTTLSSSNLVATLSTIPNILNTNITASTIIVTGGSLNATFNSNTIGSIVTTGGNVGIGTSLPSQRLHVSGGNIHVDGSLTPTIRLVSTGANQSNSGEIRLLESNDVIGWAMRHNSITSNDALQFIRLSNTGENSVMTLNGITLRVGINTTNPSFDLDVNGTLNASTYLTSGALYSTNQTTTNIVATASTITNLSVPGTLTVVNITSTNLVETNITAATIIVTGGSLNATFNSNTIGSIITTGGNVGIGTTPATHLHILSSNSTGVMIDTSNFSVGATNNYIFKHASRTARINSYLPGGNNIDLYFNTHSGTTNTERNVMYMSGSTGNVGIGTTSPSTRLDINGNFQATGSLHTLGSIIISSGNVGINTTNPTFNLDVNGTINANNSLSIGGGISSFFAGSFNANNNVSSATNITGLLFPTASVRSFVATLTVNLNKSGGNLNEMITLEGVQRDSGWILYDTALGDDTGLVFTINSAGQVQYTSPNYTGWVSTTIRFEGHYYTLSGTYTPPALATSSNITLTGQLALSNATDVTNTSTASFTLAGGAGIAKSLLVGGNVNVGGLSNTFTGSFAAANNVTSPTNVSGFLVPTATFSSFTASVNVRLITTTSTLNAQYLFEATQTTSGWLLNDSLLGDSVGITFTITSTGQIQYTSTNTVNWQSTTINYAVTAISISSGFTAVLPTSGNVNISGNLTIDSTTDSSSTSAASLVLAGGAGINKSLLIGGNLNIGGVATQFAGTFSAANGASGANVSGLSFPNATIRSFSCTISVRVVSSINYNTQHTIEGIQTGSGGWQISDYQIGDSSGIVFNINSSGQITYTSPTFITWTSTTMHFNAIAYNISSSYTPIPMPTGGSSSVAGSLVIQGTEPASSTSSGSLSISGGVGIQKNLIVANNFFVNTNGNVGIGTSSPSQQLTISDDQRPFLRFERNGSGRYDFDIGMNATADLIFRGGADISLGGSLTEYMRIGGGGNVGIGTTSPFSNLHVKSNSTSGELEGVISLQNSHPTFARGIAQIKAVHDGTLGAGNALTFSTRQDSGGNFDPTALINERMRITNGGNVGIGTSIPSYTLDVNGTFDVNNSNGLMLFSSNGNLGIGTTSPSLKLDIIVSGNGNGASITGNSNTGLTIKAINSPAGNVTRGSSITIKSASAGDKALQFFNYSTDIISNTDVSYSFLNSSAAAIFTIQNNGALTAGNTPFKVYKITGTFPGTNTTSYISLPSGVSASSILSFIGYTVSSNNDIVPFDYRGDSNWIVSYYIDSTNSRVVLINTGTQTLNRSYFITIMATT